MPTARTARLEPAAVLDVVVFVVGVGVGLLACGLWFARDGSLISLPSMVAIALVVVMVRFPLVLTNQAGDVVIGFETCVLVFLVLTVPPVQALALWSIAMAVAQGTQRKVVAQPHLQRRADHPGRRAAGRGGGAAGTGTVRRRQRARRDHPGLRGLLHLRPADDRVLAVDRGAGAAVGGAALAVGAAGPGLLRRRRHARLPGRAAVPVRARPGRWRCCSCRSARSWSRSARSAEARLAQQRLSGLLEAAIAGPGLDRPRPRSRASLVGQAAADAAAHRGRAAAASRRSSRRSARPVEVPGRPARYLVVHRVANGDHFDREDRKALDALDRGRRRRAEPAPAGRRDAVPRAARRADRPEQPRRLRRPARARAQPRAAPTGTVAVLYCDLDGFKAVNDLFGHEAGDRLLVVGRRADPRPACARTTPRPGWAATSSAILLDDISRGRPTRTSWPRACWRRCSRAFHVGGREFRVEASIGIAYAGRDAHSAEALLRSADTAMYRAKALGKGRAERFAPQMRSEDLRRIELEVELRRAVEEDLLEVHYQPVVDLHTGEVHGVRGAGALDAPDPRADRPGDVRADGRAARPDPGPGPPGAGARARRRPRDHRGARGERRDACR